MPSRSIPFVPDSFYHLYNRGVNRGQIFFSNNNYTYFLRLVTKNLGRYGLKMVAYCLLPNHFHFLVRTGENNTISSFMKSLQGSYTMALNKQLDRVGPLYQSRYRCIFVDKEEYLLQLARYIHLNPVVAKLAQLPDAWPYSNYADIIGKRQGILKDTSLVPERFRTCAEYQEFVESYLIELRRSPRFPVA